MMKLLVPVLGIIIGLLVLAAGIYFLVKEKADPESKKIYTIVTVIGAVIIVAALLMLIF